MLRAPARRDPRRPTPRAARARRPALVRGYRAHLLAPVERRVRGGGFGGREEPSTLAGCPGEGIPGNRGFGNAGIAGRSSPRGREPVGGGARGTRWSRARAGGSPGPSGRCGGTRSSGPRTGGTVRPRPADQRGLHAAKAGCSGSARELERRKRERLDAIDAALRERRGAKRARAREPGPSRGPTSREVGVVEPLGVPAGSSPPGRAGELPRRGLLTSASPELRDDRPRDPNRPGGRAAGGDRPRAATVRPRRGRRGRRRGHLRGRAAVADRRRRAPRANLPPLSRATKGGWRRTCGARRRSARRTRR